MVWRPDYITGALLKSEVRVDDTIDDAQFARWATASSRAVDRHCHRQFGLCDAPEERFYEGTLDRNLGVWVYDIDDVMTQVGMVVENDAGTVLTDGKLYPRNAIAEGEPYTELRLSAGGCEISLTARFGWTTTPAQVVAASLLQGTRFAARRDSPYGIAGSPADGSELRLLARVDPDVEVMLSGLRRESWVG